MKRGGGFIARSLTLLDITKADPQARMHLRRGRPGREEPVAATYEKRNTITTLE